MGLTMNLKIGKLNEREERKEVREDKGERRRKPELNFLN